MSVGIIAGVVTVGAGIYSARKSAKAAQGAAETQAEAQRQAGDTIWKQFKATEAHLQPFVGAGAQAHQQQAALSGALGPEAQQEAYSNYVESPGVQFLREQGMRGIDQQASARGKLHSGSRDKARIRYSQNLALQGLQNRFNELGAVTGTGLAAAQAIGGVGAQAAQGQAGFQAGAGQTLGQGQVARQSAINQGVSQGVQALGFASGLGGFNRPQARPVAEPNIGYNPNRYYSA